MRTRLLLMAVLAFAAPSWKIAYAAPPSQLAPLDFLIGDWDAVRAKADDASGKTTFSRALQDRVIERKNFADYPTANGRPASRHDDLMLIYTTAAAVRADYFDSEGHVIHYAVTSPAANQAVFLSDANPGEPRYRLSYKLGQDGQLEGRFEVAAPGQSDAFKPYLAWKSTKAKTDRS
jgi:hypothetical protein